MNPLTIPKADLGRGALAAGRPHAVFIVPVAPVGHYDLLADRCNAERLSLRRLVLINMGEYLTADGLDWIPPATHRGAEKLESATGITLTEIRTMKRPKAIVPSPISRYGRRPPP